MTTTSPFTTVRFRPTTEDDHGLPAFDNTKLTAINTCPTYGILRYEMHKRMPASGRAMALEAGHVMHDVFAAVRLWELGFVQQERELFEYHGYRLFGAARFARMKDAIREPVDETMRLNFCLEALYSSGYTDDPRDDRRTMTNLEVCAIAYIQRYEFGKWPVWIRTLGNPKSDVGIEVPVDMVIEFDLRDGSTFSIRFTGRMDGVHIGRNHTSVVIQENKTASRLNDAWTQAFYMSHQITGYCMAMSLWTQHPVSEAIIRGITIPLYKNIDYGGVVTLPVTRDQHHFTHWVSWLYHTLQVWREHKDDVINAPRYTHSCNRYFTPCSFIPFCAVDDEEKQRTIEEMVHDEWSPLNEIGHTDT